MAWNGRDKMAIPAPFCPGAGTPGRFLYACIFEVSVVEPDATEYSEYTIVNFDTQNYI